LELTNSSIAWKIEITIPDLQIYSPKKANSEKLGLGIENPCRSDEQVLEEG
jgi:hypothetical protein